MAAKQGYTIKINSRFDVQKIQKGSWIVLVNAKRVPPHVGLIFNGKYNSLNTTGQEVDINVLALLKRIELLKIKAVFVRLKPHPVFSLDYLHEHFKIQVQRYDKVETGKATCFTPVRSFFVENYLLPEEKLAYLYHLFPCLYEVDVVAESFCLHLGEDVKENNIFTLPVYTGGEIADKLANLQREYNL